MKEIAYVFALSPGEEDRLRVEAAVEKGTVEQFVVQYEARIQGRWVPIVRYDTAHGFAHRDVFFMGKQTVKQVLPISDFYEAFTFAVNDIKLLWQHYRDKFEKGAS